MSADSIKTEQEEENDKWFKLGKIARLEEISKEVLRESGDYFEKGKDDLAKIFRSFSIVLKDRAEVERKNYDKKYHKNSL